MSKRTPEYESLRTFFHSICASISSQFQTMVPLTEDLYAARIISEATRDSIVSGKGTPTYELAAWLLPAVQTIVQYKPEQLYCFADKLVQHGHEEVVVKLLKECEKRGGRKVPDETQFTEREDDDDEQIDDTILSQEPSLRLFIKYFKQVLEDKWKSTGALLGLSESKLKVISCKTSMEPLMDVFDHWKQADEVEFTWKTLFTELRTANLIDQKRLVEIRTNIIQELSK